eukprot:366194-Chlamydomonas_euryale.AAC.2
MTGCLLPTCLHTFQTYFRHSFQRISKAYIDRARTSIDLDRCVGSPHRYQGKTSVYFHTTSATHRILTPTERLSGSPQVVRPYLLLEVVLARPVVVVVAEVEGLHTARVGAYPASAEQRVNMGQARPRASHRLPHRIQKNKKRTTAQRTTAQRTTAQQEAEQSNQHAQRYKRQCGQRQYGQRGAGRQVRPRRRSRSHIAIVTSVRFVHHG